MSTTEDLQRDVSEIERSLGWHKTGGPVQPIVLPLKDGQNLQHYGMDMREIYAIAALQGMLAHSTRYKPRFEHASMGWHDAIATEAFELADAMLRAGRPSS